MLMSSGKLEIDGPAESAPMSESSKSPPPTKAMLLKEEAGREERQMRGRVEEASEHLTFDKLFELRERERALQGMSDAASVRRDVNKVRHRMIMHGRFLLDPGSSQVQLWDLCILMALIFTVCITPYEISFLPPQDWSNPANLFITGLFSLDICKEFLLPYRLPFKKGGGRIKNHRMIAKHYLKTWAAVDIIATIPVDFFMSLATTDQSVTQPLKVVKMLRLARLLRLGRLLRASRVVNRVVESLEEYVTISFTQREVAFWTAAMLIAFHWLSCTWGLLAQLRTSQRTPELEIARLAAVPACELGSGSCLSECELELLSDLLTSNVTGRPADVVALKYNELWLCRAIMDGVLPAEEEGQHAWNYLYILCDMVLSFGIGVYPRHNIEYALAFLCVVINMVMNTFFLGVVATAMSQSDPLTRDFKARMDHLNHYLSESDAPRDLRHRTREYLKYTRDLVARKSFDDVYATFSPRLRDDLHAHASMRTLTVVPFLNDCEEAFLRSLAPKLTHHGFEATEQVLLSGPCLCIVTRGTAVKAGKPITLKQFWGEDFILSSASLRDTRPASALTYMEMVCLKREDLLESAEAFPEAAKKLRLAALHLAMIRAPLLISRYFEMKMPDPQLQAAVRRGLTPGKKGFLGRGSGSMGDGDGRDLSSRSALSTTTQSDVQRQKRFQQDQSLAFDKALRNLGKKASIQQREFHGIMRGINGGAALRGFARDQRYSEDVEMSTQARDALKVAGDEGRLILDEEGAVVGADGKTVYVATEDAEDPAVTAVRDLRKHLAAEMGNMRRALQSLRGAVGEDVTPDWPWIPPTGAVGPGAMVPANGGGGAPPQLSKFRRKQRVPPMSGLDA